MRYKTRPEFFKAIQLGFKNRDDISRWINGGYSGRDGGGKRAWYYDSNGDDQLYFLDDDGLVHTLGASDWVLENQYGKFSVVGNSAFIERYEAAP